MAQKRMYHGPPSESLRYSLWYFSIIRVFQVGKSSFSSYIIRFSNSEILQKKKMLKAILQKAKNIIREKILIE